MIQPDSFFLEREVLRDCYFPLQRAKIDYVEEVSTIIELSILDHGSPFTNQVLSIHIFYFSGPVTLNLKGMEAIAESDLTVKWTDNTDKTYDQGITTTYNAGAEYSTKLTVKASSASSITYTCTILYRTKVVYTMTWVSTVVGKFS